MPRAAMMSEGLPDPEDLAKVCAAREQDREEIMKQVIRLLEVLGFDMWILDAGNSTQYYNNKGSRVHHVHSNTDHILNVIFSLLTTDLGISKRATSLLMATITIAMMHSEGGDKP